MDSLKLCPPESECSHRCQSIQHGGSLTSTVSLRSISSSAVISYMHWLCGNCGLVVDGLGRSALHVAASCGCQDVARWLVRQCGASINQKDSESGYTPLHRSIFYGQVHVAVSLIRLGASVMALDYENLTAFDHAMKDRMSYVEFNVNNPCEVYSWGTNNNYTLGIGNQPERSVPENVDFFRKQNISIKQVAMNKFHSVFVTHDGRAFSCGHGQGGRLGLQNEKAALLPGHIKMTPTSAGTDTHVIAASIGRDHTVLLTDGGSVWTCGCNSHHQLGHSPPPQALQKPLPLPPRVLRGLGTVLGVCAGRFHTVIWSSKGLMTCGLHAGQLGHSKSPEVTQIVPRLVVALPHKENNIRHVAASDGATAVLTTKGDIYALTEYQCRKIASRLLDVVKIVVVGGRLDSRGPSNILMEQGGDQLKIAALTSSGKLLLWQESSQQMLRCLFNLNRPLNITDVALSRTSTLLLATNDGEAFEGELKARKSKKQSLSSGPTSNTPAFNGFLEKSDCEQVRVKRLLHVHRAVSVNLDPKARNFAVVQTHPQAALLAVPVVETSEIREQMTALLQDACTQDSIHDVVFVIGGREFAAHRFVVASQSEPLSKLMESNVVDSMEVPRVKVSNVNASTFEQILMYIYTRECDLLKPGKCSLQKSGRDSKENKEENVDLNRVSAYQVYSGEKNNKVKNKNAPKKQTDSDPIKMLKDAARRFGLTSLQAKLKDVKYENGVVKSAEVIKDEDIRFDYKSHQELYDLTVKCEDGKEVRAHKCMLIARSEYFNSMLNHGWLESSQSNVLRLPIPQNIIELLIEFLYTNDCSTVRESEDLDLVCNVLVVADQLFAGRLKEICEVALAGMITLKNIATILQFADSYNANQLKECCMQYICLNLSAVLETRGLENVDKSVLEELSKYYREFNPLLSKREITPYADAPQQSLIEAVAEAYPVSALMKEESDVIETLTKKASKPLKKKSQTRKSFGNDNNKSNERTRNESLSSCHSGDESLSFEKQSLGFDDLEEKNGVDEVTLKLHELRAEQPTSPPDTKIKVTSPHKSVVASIKMGMLAKEDADALEMVDNFTKVTKRNQSSEMLPTKTQQAQVFQKPPSEITSPLQFATSLPVPISPPLDSISNFPLLGSPPSTSSVTNSCRKTAPKVTEVRNISKISQKQRKKIAAELGEQNKKESQTLQFSWGIPKVQSQYSMHDIISEELQQSKSGTISISVPVSSGTKPESPPRNNPWAKAQVNSPVGSPETAVNFCDIIADEKKQRGNWTKMRAKPLELTQLEDKAIDDLIVFYNAAEMHDERITVRRVITGNIAAPTWITNHH